MAISAEVRAVYNAYVRLAEEATDPNEQEKFYQLAYDSIQEGFVPPVENSPVPPQVAAAAAPPVRESTDALRRRLGLIPLGSDIGRQEDEGGPEAPTITSPGAALRRAQDLSNSPLAAGLAYLSPALGIAAKGLLAKGLSSAQDTYANFVFNSNPNAAAAEEQRLAGNTTGFSKFDAKTISDLNNRLAFIQDRSKGDMPAYLSGLSGESSRLPTIAQATSTRNRLPTVQGGYNSETAGLGAGGYMSGGLLNNKDSARSTPRYIEGSFPGEADLKAGSALHLPVDIRDLQEPVYQTPVIQKNSWAEQEERARNMAEAAIRENRDFTWTDEELHRRRI